MKPAVMLIGLGGLGNVIMEFLVREERLGPIVACDLNKELRIRRLASCPLDIDVEAEGGG